MIKTIEITHRGAVPRSLKKAHNRSAKEAWRTTATHWQTELRPAHFTPAGAAKYGYIKRKGERQTGAKFKRSYMGRKLREHGHQDPLVFSGESKRRSQVARISATAKGGATVRLSTPALNFKHPKSQIDMNAELRAIPQSDADDLARVFDRQYDREMKKPVEYLKEKIV